MTAIEELKIILRENDTPYFTDADLEYYLSKNNDSVNDTAYQCLIVKSENSTLSVSGLNTTDTSIYFRRLAKKYRPNNSGILGGGF
jgi:hypothetical protein